MKATDILFPALLLCGCSRVSEGTRNALNKGGEFAGSAATEVVEGVTSGVEKTWSLRVELSDELKHKGLAIGRTQVESDSLGFDNKLIIYLSSEQAFTGELHAIAVDADGVEMGRATLSLDLAVGSADYHTVLFQSRTDLERKCRVEIR
ncbi:MAG: hypothetical protein IPI81_09330 [Flavobacteriales bacterium]|nr:hypothetical protein [Flavobacteriales bacterium]MCC6937509.1 hypothetical protein [Flavobacteriales bacterium]